MKIKQLQINIEQLAQQAQLLENSVTDEEVMCRVLDAKEYLARAWWALEGRYREDNQTTLEMTAAMKTKDCHSYEDRSKEQRNIAILGGDPTL